MHAGPQALELICRTEAWMRQANCRGKSAIMFSETGPGIAEAKALCDGCPCLASCLDYALAFGPSLQGVWGGLTRRERIRALRQAA